MHFDHHAHPSFGKDLETKLPYKSPILCSFKATFDKNIDHKFLLQIQPLSTTAHVRTADCHTALLTNKHMW